VDQTAVGTLKNFDIGGRCVAGVVEEVWKGRCEGWRDIVHSAFNKYRLYDMFLHVESYVVVCMTSEADTANTFGYITEWDIFTVAFPYECFEFLNEVIGGRKVLTVIDVHVQVEVFIWVVRTALGKRVRVFRNWEEVVGCKGGCEVFVENSVSLLKTVHAADNLGDVGWFGVLFWG
jgi:hypothetical protein